MSGPEPDADADRAARFASAVVWCWLAAGVCGAVAAGLAFGLAGALFLASIWLTLTVIVGLGRL